MKGLYISIFVLGTFFANAQSDLYSKLNSYLTNQTKEVTTDRLIAVNVWSLNDKNSRDLNLEFEKAYKTYEYAKLKGGSKGIIVLDINIDSDLINPDVVLQKDGVTKLINIPSDNKEIIEALKDKIKVTDIDMDHRTNTVYEDKTKNYNIVFDSNGNKVYENLTSGNVFNSIHQLITR